MWPVFVSLRQKTQSGEWFIQFCHLNAAQVLFLCTQPNLSILGGRRFLPFFYVLLNCHIMYEYDLESHKD